MSVSWKADSVNAGRMRCISPSRVSSPVVQVPKDTTSPRPEAGHPLQLHGEDPDQHDADDEVGQAHAEQRAGHQHLGAGLAAAQRRIDPERYAQAQRDEAGHQGQFQRGRKALGNEAGDLAALTQADAEIALRGVADEARELHREGLIQPQVLAQCGALFFGRVLAQQVGDRVADVLEQHEGDEGHRQHDDDGLDQAAKDEDQHEDVLCGASMRCAKAR